jgi:hypothetical protein
MKAGSAFIYYLAEGTDPALIDEYELARAQKLQGEGRSRAVGRTAWWGSRAFGRRSRWWRPRTATDGSS